MFGAELMKWNDIVLVSLKLKYTFWKIVSTFGNLDPDCGSFLDLLRISDGVEV